MLVKIKGELQFECDTCMEVLATGDSDFAYAQQALRAEGWTTRKDDGVWEHICPDCRRAELHAASQRAEQRQGPR